MPESFDLRRGSFSALADDVLDGKAISRLMFCYRTIGCAHYRRPEGGCRMCAFPENSTLGTAVSIEELQAQLDNELAQHDWSKEQLAEINLFCAGSFFNDEEIPPAVRAHAFRRISALPHVKKLLVESRPEYISEAALAAAQTALGSDITLEVAIGLESADDYVRETVIAKGFTRADFERALTVLAATKASLLVYVLLKPPGLSEAEALRDCEATIRYVFSQSQDRGIQRVTAAIQPSFVQREGLLYDLWQRGEFQPPRLWTVVELIERTHMLGELQIGTANDSPPPVAIRGNCGRCDEAVEAAITAFNASQDVEIFAGLSCPCRPTARAASE